MNRDRRRYAPGLRFKFNAVVLPVLAAIIMAVVWLDYRHEVGAVMAAHAVHSGPVESERGSGPVDPATTPEVIGRQSLVMHAAYGAVMLVVAMACINAALFAFVLHPLDRIRQGFTLMERGHWRMPTSPAPRDEVGQLAESLQELGLTLDAFVGQMLRAERLATLALLARRTASQIEPEVQRIGLAVGRLHGLPQQQARQDSELIACASAEILTAVRGLDRLFEANLRHGSGPTPSAG